MTYSLLFILLALKCLFYSLKCGVQCGVVWCGAVLCHVELCGTVRCCVVRCCMVLYSVG